MRIDDTTQRIACALQISGRAGWGEIARALELPTRTVMRRGQALLDEGLIRVTAMLDTQRLVDYGAPVLLRLRCMPGAIEEVCGRLAERPDTRNVFSLTGSADCFAEVLPHGVEALRRLIHIDLPGLGGVSASSTYSVMKFFTAASGWHADLLTAEEQAALVQPGVPAFGDSNAIEELTAEEEPIVEILTADGRTPVTEIASRLDLSLSTASRRIDSLIQRGIVRIRTEVAPEVFSLRTEALLWLQVRAGQIDQVGEKLARHRSVRTVSAHTGEYQICCHVFVADHRALYAFLTETVGSIAEVTDVDVTVVLDAVKRGGLLPNDHTAAVTPEKTVTKELLK